MTRAEAIERVVAERERVAHLLASGTLAWTADQPACPDVLRLAALVEEVGEVARCVHDGADPTRELIQAAGVAIAWLEGIG